MWGCATAANPDGSGDGDGDGDGDLGGDGDGDGDLGPDAGTLPGELVPVSLSHSSSETIEAGNSVACLVRDPFFGLPLFTDEASFYRTFDLAAEGVTRDLEVTQVRVGIESATPQPLDVRLHTVNGSMSSMTQVAAAQIQLPDQGAGVVAVDIAATIPAGSVLAVEVHASSGEADGDLLFFGSNTAGQTAPTYFRSAPCGASTPVDVAGTASDMHLVLSVEGMY